jgi:hypothetical protein
MSNRVHIVCLDAPSPPDYGGAMDMYYAIIALAAQGKKIILHYFDYKQDRNADGLAAYCSQIYAYRRKSFFRSASLLPYIVRSRINSKLIQRLNEDEFPVILEGIHTSGIIPYLNNQNRAVIRMHNEEVSYYKNLAVAERNIFKRTYFRLESALLKKYYRKLPANTPLACLSQADMIVLENEYQFSDLHLIPCFIPWQVFHQKEGRGDYCLYHGNMSVSENEAAAEWLIEKVCSALDMKFIIAGKAISTRLRQNAAKVKTVELITDPSTEELTELIRNAQVHILPSMNTTGVKLKLLHALFDGRFCITNANGAKGIGSNEGFLIADTADEYVEAIKTLWLKNFCSEDKKSRQHLLAVYNNLENARKLSALC